MLIKVQPVQHCGGGISCSALSGGVSCACGPLGTVLCCRVVPEAVGNVQGCGRLPVPPCRDGSLHLGRGGHGPGQLWVPPVQGGEKSERLFLPAAEAQVQCAGRGLGGRVDSLKACVGPC